MAEYSIIDSNQVIMRVSPVTKAARILFAFFVGTGIIVPILVVAFVAVSDEELKASVLLSFALFWGSSFFLFRMYSWNVSGEETLSIEIGKATLTSKSKHFTFNEKGIEAERIVFSAMPSRSRQINNQEVQTGKLMIVNLDDMSESVTGDVELPMTELKSLLSTLNNGSVGKRQLGDGETEF